jgi:hypothetical protein
MIEMTDQRGKTPTVHNQPKDLDFIALLQRLGEQAQRATREAERKGGDHDVPTRSRDDH